MSRETCPRAGILQKALRLADSTVGLAWPGLVWPDLALPDGLDAYTECPETQDGSPMNLLPWRLRACVLLMLLAPAVLGALEESSDEDATPDAAVDKGLAVLANMQQSDGTFNEGSAVTALAGMAFLAGGNTANRGLYHAECARCLKSLIDHQDQVSGYLSADAGNMYGHGFATLFLAESYGMAPDLAVRRALEAAVDLIYSAQNQEGGWRYSPNPSSADISVTICQVMALRAAYNAGVGGDETQACMQRALAYVRRCANGNGSFSYTANMGGDFGSSGAEGIPRTAAGCMCLIGMGVTDTKDRNLGPSLLYVRKYFAEHLRTAETNFWYGQYYTAQAMFHSPNLDDWQSYWRLARKIILQRQSSAGSWTQGEGPGPAYATAMALIILQIPNNYLPIFQR
jgi:hypothetical protein